MLFIRLDHQTFWKVLIMIHILKDDFWCPFVDESWRGAVDEEKEEERRHQYRREETKKEQSIQTRVRI